MNRILLAIGIGLGIGATTVASAQVLAQPGSSSAVRAIDDPHAGMRWLLLRNPDHPGGPGRLVPVHGAAATSPIFHFERGAADAGNGLHATLAPVIRAGDAVIVEEDSAVASVRLEGVATMPAAAGANLKVRLRTAATVSAIAIAPGRVRLAGQFERQP